MDENQQVVVWCEPCGAEVGHWRINAALRICTGCGNEIHEEEKIMGKHFTPAERAGIQLRLTQGETVKELADEFKRPYATIKTIERSMPKGLKGKKLEAALRKAAVDKHATKGQGSITVPAGLPRGVSLQYTSDEVAVGGGMKTYNPLATGLDEQASHKRWIVSLINRRLDLIRAELLSLVTGRDCGG